MKNLVILLIGFLLLSAGKAEENLELRIFNDSRFKIEKLKITCAGKETVFENIEPKSYSEAKKVECLWKDNCYDVTIFKKKLFARNFWAHGICFPVDHIGDNKIKSGKYVLSLKIKQTNDTIKKFDVESEYIVDKKNE